MNFSDFPVSIILNSWISRFISKLLFESFDNWIFCGFYFQENNKLFVSEYSANKIPCSPIEFNGVCGTAILKNKILSNDLKKRDANYLRAIQLIFQNPDESLNPIFFSNNCILSNLVVLITLFSFDLFK